MSKITILMWLYSILIKSCT